MKQCATYHAADWPEAARIVHDDFYVDDCFTGADTVYEAITLRKNLSTLLTQGGFELAKWASNNSRVLIGISEAQGVIDLGE